MGRQRGYQKDGGVGKVFAHHSFLSKESVQGTHELLRPLVAELHDLCPWQLDLVASGATLKYPSSPELPPHRDVNRDGSYQIVVAASTTSFSVWPGTHEYAGPMIQGPKKTYLSKKGVANLIKAGYVHCAIPGEPGDVMLFIGGQVIHGSPGVPSDSHYPRICTYPEFWPKKSGVKRKRFEDVHKVD